MSSTPATNPVVRTWWPRRRTRWIVFLVAVLVFGVAFRRPLFQGNFAVVDPGKVYRSSQPGADWKETIQGHSLGSVVNLRGGSEADSFYRHEADIAEQLGVEFYDLHLAATRRPTRRELLLALAVLDRCRYPLLIHCKWGADRTGLVSALYRLVKLGEPPEKAMAEFTLKHGHIPLFGPERLHEPIEEYAEWLARTGQTHEPERFRTWVEREYEAEDRFFRRPTIEPGRRARLAVAADRVHEPR